MDRRHLPLTALRSFEAVGRHMSFARAAEALGVTHGAVSRQVAALESMLGLKLFERGTQLAFTAEGKRLFAGISPAFDALSAALDSVQAGARHRTLSVNAPPTFTMRWLIPRLAVFQRQHEDVDVKLSTGIGPRSELNLNEIDITIRRLPPDGGGMPATPFLSSTLLVVCAPELIEDAPVTNPADLARFPFIEAATSAVTWAEWFERTGQRLPAQARFRRFEEMYFAVEAALEGLGVALLPSALVVDDLIAGRLRIAYYAAGVYDRDYFYIPSSPTRRRDLVKAFGAWLRQEGEDCNNLAQSVIRAHQVA